MNKRFFFKYLIPLLLIISCKKDQESDVYGINYHIEETVNAMVVDTEMGWMLLSETYGFLDLIEPLPNEWKTDGLLIRASIHKGKTYFDDASGSIDAIETYKELTFADLAEIEVDSNLYTGTTPPTLQIVWSPNHSDETVKYPDGYGYVVRAKEQGYVIGQYHFPGVTGLGTFKNETEAKKMGMLVLHLMIKSNDLPGTDLSDLNFLKIDWYVYIPD